jgi:hypothetical protein
MRDRYANLKQGLAGAWIPSLGATGSLLLDRSGNGYHGVINPNISWVASGDGVSLDSNGTTGYRTTVDVTSGPLKLMLENNWTIGCWHLSRQGSVSHVLFAVESYGYFYFYPSETYTTMRIYWGTVNFTISSSTVETAQNKWVHSAVTYDRASETAYFYRNGVFSNSVTSSARGSSDVISKISFLGGDLNQNYDAQFDDMRCYTRTLTAPEIAQLALRRRIGFEPIRRRQYKAPPPPPPFTPTLSSFFMVA